VEQEPLLCLLNSTNLKAGGLMLISIEQEGGVYG
jgi:hypothetical protein